MSSTLVIQSHSNPLPFNWLKRCIESVRSWSDLNQFDYRWLGDELFSSIEPGLLKKIGSQKVIASDIGRLQAIKQGLKTHQRVLWFDSDFLVFDPENLVLPESKGLNQGYMLGREVWVQEDAERPNKLKAYVKVHNAFLLFDRENSFLDFYLSHAEQLLRECAGSIPPQFIGPKLLTAIHNVVGCPVLENAGMLSPMVIDDLLSEGKNNCALNLMRKRSNTPLAGANLCSSLMDETEAAEARMAKLIDILLEPGGLA